MAAAGPAAMLIAALVTACGSASPDQAGGTPPAHRAGHRADRQAGHPATATCPPGGLRVALDMHAAGVAAGSEYLPLDFTNTSGRRCLVCGYPSVSFRTGVSGSGVGRPAAPDRALAAAPVILAPGQAAHAWLVIAAAGNYPAARCHPVTAAGLRVRAPGQDRASYLGHPFPACAATAHGAGLLTVQPIQPGLARRGTAA